MTQPTIPTACDTRLPDGHPPARIDPAPGANRDRRPLVRVPSLSPAAARSPRHV